MPKPDKVQNHVTEWLEGQDRGDLVAWCRVRRPVAIHTAPDSHRTNTWSVGGQREAKVAMGFADRESSTTFDTTYAYVLTSSEFLVLQLSGFKERVKELAIHSPVDHLTLHYVDVPAEHGVFRNVALELPAGRFSATDRPATFVHDLLKYTTKNGDRGPFSDVSDRFVASFGPNAVCHTASL